MNETDETSASATAQPTAQPGSATSETVIVSVDEAAELFGISPQAIRKRLSKGSLRGHKDAQGQWRVYLDRATHETGATATGETGPQPAAKPDAQPRNLVAASQAEQMAALVASIQAPLLDRIGSANRELERERVQRETIERERDELRAIADGRAYAEAQLAAVRAERDDALAEVELLREIQQMPESTEDTEPFTPIAPSSGETSTEPPAASPAPPGSTDAPAMAQDTLQPEPHRRAWWERLIGRS